SPQVFARAGRSSPRRARRTSDPSAGTTRGRLGGDRPAPSPGRPARGSPWPVVGDLAARRTRDYPSRGPATSPATGGGARRRSRRRRESDRPPPTLPEDLDADRNDGEDDHHDDNDVHVVTDVRDHSTQQVARPCHAGHPSYAAGHIVEEEPVIFHLTDARDDRREGPDDRDESGDDDRLRAVARIERPRPIDVAGVEQERLRPREEPRAEARPDRVAHAVPGDRGDDEERVDPPDVERARRGDDSRRDQERVAGQEEADEQTRLGKDDPE